MSHRCTPGRFRMISDQSLVALNSVGRPSSAESAIHVGRISEPQLSFMQIYASKARKPVQRLGWRASLNAGHGWQQLPTVTCVIKRSTHGALELCQ